MLYLGHGNAIQNIWQSRTLEFHLYLAVINNEMMSVKRNEAEGEGGGEGEDEGAGQGEGAEQGEGRKGPVGHRVELQG